MTSFIVVIYFFNCNLQLFVLCFQLNLPMNSVVPGAELTKEPFRWDQRIFSLVMRLPASVPPDVSAFPFIPSAENTAIDVMCEVTGGVYTFRCFVTEILSS